MVKNIRECKAPNCNKCRNGKDYCSAHERQVRKYGTILPRKITDPNEIHINGDTCIMDIYNKYGVKVDEVLLDTADLEIVSSYKWTVNTRGYAYRLAPEGHISMSRLLMGNPDKTVDHINGNTRDNRRFNLRLATLTENVRNAVIPKNNTSGYKGVSWDKKANKYSAYISPNRKHIFLGYYQKAKDAAVAYNNAAIKYFGEFAKLNTFA